MRNRIKQMLTTDVGYKLLALALGFLVWLLILNTEDPVETRDISDIEIMEINADDITEAGKAYSYAGGVNTVSVRVRGKSSVVSHVTRNDLYAVADLSKLSITGAVTVDVTCPRYPGLEITPIGSSTVLNVEIEDIVKKSFNVRVLTSGDPPEGKYIGTGTATPNLVTVSGPASVVGQIQDAVVQVNVTSFYTAAVTTDLDLILRSASGDEVKASSLTLSQDTISVTVPIYNTKSVPVSLQVTGEPGEGYELISAEYEPKQVSLAGTADQLAAISEIVLRDYDISGATESIEDTISVADSMTEPLPEGLIFVDSEPEIAFAADIQEIVDKTLEISLDKISLLNTKSGYAYGKTVSASDTTSTKVSLRITGAEEYIDQLTADNIRVTADTAKCTPGNNTVTLNVDLGDDVSLKEAVAINVTMTAESTAE